MAGTIICGVDGSLDSRAALGVAAALAERLGSRLILAHAVEYAKVPYDVAASLGGLSSRRALRRRSEPRRAPAARTR